MRRWLLPPGRGKVQARCCASFVSEAQKILGHTLKNAKSHGVSLQTFVTQSKALLAESSTVTDIDEKASRKLLSIFSSAKAYTMRMTALQTENQRLQDAIQELIERIPSTAQDEVAAETVVEEVVEETKEGDRGVGTDDISETMSVGEITLYLHQKGADFSDCFDAAALRERFRYVRSGKYEEDQKGKTAARREQERLVEEQAERERIAQMPPRPEYHQRSPGDAGVIPDPHPGARRDVVDPRMKIAQLKIEMCARYRVPAPEADLWCDGKLLDDERYVGEYPELERATLEIRPKGKKPSPKT